MRQLKEKKWIFGILHFFGPRKRCPSQKWECTRTAFHSGFAFRQDRIRTRDSWLSSDAKPEFKWSWNLKAAFAFAPDLAPAHPKKFLFKQKIKNASNSANFKQNPLIFCFCSIFKKSGLNKITVPWLRGLVLRHLKNTFSFEFKYFYLYIFRTTKCKVWILTRMPHSSVQKNLEFDIKLLITFPN